MCEGFFFLFLLHFVFKQSFAYIENRNDFITIVYNNITCTSNRIYILFMIFGGRKIHFLSEFVYVNVLRHFIVKTSPLIISLSVLWILKAVYRKTNPLLHSVFVLLLLSTHRINFYCHHVNSSDLLFYEFRDNFHLSG